MLCGDFASIFIYVDQVVISVLKDIDRDSRVSFVDFQTAVTDDKLLLECLGRCLPDEKVCRCVIAYRKLFLFMKKIFALDGIDGQFHICYLLVLLVGLLRSILERIAKH